MNLSHNDPLVIECAKAGADACGLPHGPVLTAIAWGILRGERLPAVRNDPRGPEFQAAVLAHAETLPALADADGVKQLRAARAMINAVDGVRK